jgi:hypothetical protein
VVDFMKWIAAVALWLGLATAATAQTFPGILPAGNVVGNPSGSPAPPTAFPIFSTANSWPAIQSFIGSNVAAITTDGAQTVVQNSSITQSNIFTPVTGGVVYDGSRSTVFIPPSSTVLNAEGYGSYIRNRSGTSPTMGNGVNFYGLATCGVSTTSCWFANGRLVDSEDAMSHAFTGVQLIGTEMDYLVTSAATVIEGHSIIYSSTANFAGGNGFQITNSTPTFGKLTNAFVSGDAAAVTAMNVGATVATGTNGVGNLSQSIRWAWWDSATPSVEHASLMFADAAGQLNWPGTISLNGAAATQVILNMSQNSVAKWQVGTLANGNFFAFDSAGSAFVWQMPTAGTLAFTPRISAPSIQASTIYSAAGTPLPTCNAGTDSTTAIVSDATGATYAAAYTSGGAQKRRVLCVNGTGWITN